MSKEQTKEQPREESKMRQIIIETDGNKIHLVKSEVAGRLELKSILAEILGEINNN